MGEEKRRKEGGRRKEKLREQVGSGSGRRRRRCLGGCRVFRLYTKEHHAVISGFYISYRVIWFQISFCLQIFEFSFFGVKVLLV